MRTEIEPTEILRIQAAIAEKCGWTFHDVKRAPKDGGGVFEKLWLRPGVKLEELTADDIAWREGKILPPEYLTDRNACAEMLATLDGDGGHLFGMYLQDIVRPHECEFEGIGFRGVFEIANATPEQLCQAFCQLNGIPWIGEKPQPLSTSWLE